MNDDLDQKTDAELDEIFAVEVAKWFREPFNRSYWRTHWPKENDPMRGYTGKQPAHTRDVHPFSTDANAVLSWLEKHNYQLTYWNGGRASIDPTTYWINLPMGSPNSVEASATTFPRAAAVALIRGARSKTAA